MTRQAGNEIDEFVTEALRNNLVGLLLDLAAINIARGRDTGVPSLNEARREFFDATQDAQLSPTRAGWTSTHLKHEASVINFIAAYGTHATHHERRRRWRTSAPRPSLLVLGGAGAPADRLDFLNGPPRGVTITGVDDIDFWIGGLAGGRCRSAACSARPSTSCSRRSSRRCRTATASTISRALAGLNFGVTELENNSFAKLIMANTDATHLPGGRVLDAGSLEVDQSTVHRGSSARTARRDDPPVVTRGRKRRRSAYPAHAVVIRDNPPTLGADTNYLRYTGVDHVVLGGTNGNVHVIILIGSEGDDTFWGDGGNDRIEGGSGNDQIEGGAGDDILTDIGGDDNIKGGAGNDVIHGGNGFNLIIGGDGKDFIITGEDVTETFAGQGDDFILGSKTNLPTLGNEGTTGSKSAPRMEPRATISSLSDSTTSGATTSSSAAAASTS